MDKLVVTIRGGICDYRVLRDGYVIDSGEVEEVNITFTKEE